MRHRHREESLSLREYVDLRTNETRAYLDLRLTELEKRLTGERALLVVANADRQAEMERRLTGLNELRNEVLADRSLFVTKDAFELVSTRAGSSVLREYYDEQHQNLAERVGANAQAIASMRSRSAAYTAAMGMALTLLTAVVIIIQIVHR